MSGQEKHVMTVSSECGDTAFFARKKKYITHMAHYHTGQKDIIRMSY